MFILMSLAGILSGLFIMMAMLSGIRRVKDRADNKYLQAVMDDLYPFLTAEDMDEKDRKFKALGATLVTTNNKENAA
jgi:hypothetical protein